MTMLPCAVKRHKPGFRLPLLLTLIAALVGAGCNGGSGDGLDANGRPLSENEGGDNDAPQVATLAQIQQEIFTPLCVVCHAGAAAPVGLKLDSANSFASLVNTPSVEVPAILRVAPGDPDESYLVQKIEGTAAVGARMPLGGAPVAADLVAALRQWIADGALPDSPPDAQPQTPVVVAMVPEPDSVLTDPPDEIVFVFNVAMDFSLLGDATVSIVASGADGVPGSADDVTIIPAAISPSNSQTMRIDLTGVPLADDDYLITLAGSGSLFLASLTGIALDGDADGDPGGDYVAGLRIAGDAATPVASWRWIQDNVFTPVCTQCHIDGGIAEFLLLDESSSFAMLVDRQSSEVGSLLLVAPGDADNSYLVQKIEGTAAVGDRMPLNLPPLDDSIVSAIRQWVDEGAQLEPGDPMPDTNAPQVSLAAPGSTLSGVVDISVAAIDDTAIAVVELFVDGASAGSDSTAPYEFALDTALLDDGAHELVATATDTAGNTGESAAITITVDNSPPPDTVAPQVNVIPPAGVLSGVATIAVDALDETGVVEVELFIDGSSLAVTATAPYEFIWNTTSVANGEYVLNARAVDAAGNVGMSADLTVTVENAPPADVVPPTVAIVVPGSPLAGSAVITVTAFDDSSVARVQLFADGLQVGELVSAPYDFTFDVGSLPDGNHLLSAVAEDEAGNAGEADPLVVEVSNGTPQPTLAWIQAEVFSASCTLCHADGASADFLWLTPGDSFGQLVNVESERGGAEFRVLPGEPDASSLVQRLDGTVLPQMPLIGPLLAAEELDAVREWIASGATEQPTDGIAPAVVLRLPVSPVAGSVILAAVAVDNVAVTEVRLFVDGTPVGTADAAPYEVVLDTVALPDGDHVVTVEAEDAAGNVTTGLPMSLTIAND